MIKTMYNWLCINYVILFKMNIKHRHYIQNIRTRYAALIVIKINNICIYRNNKLAKI